MGTAQSSNTASALADIATNVTQQTSVSQSQVANVQQSINLGAGCDIELSSDFNANYAANITQKSNQVVNTLQNANVTNDIAQKLMQTASSTVGALGVGYADASNSASMTVNATSDIKDALSATTTQQQNNFQTFNCYDSTVRAKNLNISFMTDDSFDSKQLVTNTQIAKVANKISQTATQKATATIQGIGGLLILFIILIIGGVLMFGKFVTSTGGKILSMCCMLVPIAIIFSVLYIFNCPPFFAKPNICSQGVSGPMGGCSEDKYCVDKKTNSKKITTETYVQIPTCPIRYQFPLIESASDNEIKLLPMLISNQAIVNPDDQYKNPALVNGGYNHYTWAQLYNNTTLDDLNGYWYSHNNVWGIWINSSSTTTGTDLKSSARFVPIAYVNDRYLCNPTNNSSNSDTSGSGSGTSGSGSGTSGSGTSGSGKKYNRIPNPLTLMYDESSTQNFIMIPYLLYSNLEKKTLENEDKNKCLGWTPKTTTGVVEQTGYGINTGFYKCDPQDNPTDHTDPGYVPSCKDSYSDSDSKGITPGHKKCKCDPKLITDGDKKYGYALLSPMICTITTDSSKPSLSELTTNSCHIGSKSCAKPGNCPDDRGTYANCCNKSADGIINIKPSGSFDDWVIKSSDTFSSTESVDNIYKQIQVSLNFNNAGTALEPQYKLDDSDKTNPLCFAKFNKNEWDPWLNAADVYDSGKNKKSPFVSDNNLADLEDIKIIRSMFARFWILNNITKTGVENPMNFTLTQSIILPTKSYSDFVILNNKGILGKGQLQKIGTGYKRVDNDTNGVVYYKPNDTIWKDHSDHESGVLLNGISKNTQGQFQSYFGVCKDKKYTASNISSIIIYIILGILGITFIIPLVRGGGSTKSGGGGLVSVIGKAAL